MPKFVGSVSRTQPAKGLGVVASLAVIRNHWFNVSISRISKFFALIKLDSRNIFQDVRDEAHWTELLAVVKVAWALGHG